MTSLHLTKTLPAPPERVWRALTDPATLAAWFWPTRFATTAEIDLRVGGRYRISGTGIAVSGEYLSIEPPTRLVFSWQWDGEDEHTRVTMRLTPAGAGTELSVTHEQFSDDAARDEHLKGWHDCLDRLPDWLQEATA